MRELSWSLALIASAVGCAASGEWSDTPPPEMLGDASSPPRPDAGHALPEHERDAGAPRDGSSTIDPPTPDDDGGVPSESDAAATTPRDAGTPVLDASAPSPTSDCASPIDVSSGGAFFVDTCIEPDRVGGACASPGARDALVVADAPLTGSTYQIRVPPGFIIQQVDDGCRPMAFSCGPESWGVSGAIPWRQWRFAIARADGSCGTATVEVDRTM